jgi:hypothetical protein
MTDLYLSRPGDRPLRPSPPNRGHGGRRNRPLARLLAGGFALTVLLGIAPGAWANGESANDSVAVATSDSPSRHPREKTFLKRQWGVEVVFVRQSAAGYMLEFRYKVVDADKAGPLFERQTKPLLTHAESGAKLIVPTPAKTGALRNSNPPLAGQTYWMFFANPGKLVKPGDTVSIEIGEFLVEDLIVK